MQFDSVFSGNAVLTCTAVVMQCGAACWNGFVTCLLAGRTCKIVEVLADPQTPHASSCVQQQPCKSISRPILKGA